MSDAGGTSTALFPAAYLERRSQYRAFMAEHVLPNERLLDREDDAAQELIETLRDDARSGGPLGAAHAARGRRDGRQASSTTRA